MDKNITLKKSKNNLFSDRHIGTTQEDRNSMLECIGYKSMDQFIKAVIPSNILEEGKINLGEQKTEEEALLELKQIAEQNKVYKSFIGQGHYNTHTPKVILRNVFENPGWYTSYTPYQPEISQGRLEALINFQTMVTDLTGMEISNASLLDEATAAAEAMTLAKRASKSSSDTFYVDENSFQNTINVLKTRAKPLGIELKIGPLEEAQHEEYFGVFIQYPGSDGLINDFSSIVDSIHEKKGIAVFASDLLALTLLKSPGEMGADIVVGSSQRFGVPLGCGGPHAAFMSVREDLKRSLPGRIVGASVDSSGDLAYRLALQTREQHIRREKATSNICTAQALLAIMAGFYALYHGKDGLIKIAQKVNLLTSILKENLSDEGFESKNDDFFDTLVIKTKSVTNEVHARAIENNFNLRIIDSESLGISLDETSSIEDVKILLNIFSNSDKDLIESSEKSIPESLERKSDFLDHVVFKQFHSETEMLRYIRKLSDKDIALDRAMIPLGSCTMKLNATSEMIPVSWSEFSNIHPFAPKDQLAGYSRLINEMEEMLALLTGYSAISLQPNAGSQGEYAGLLAIDAFHKSNDENRNICLIPKSAHGTNPASAQMVGLKVVPVDCDAEGNIDIDDLKDKASTHSANLSSLMITYPSTHGVFETSVSQVCEIIHSHGGLVYIDGANFNAMVGLCFPGSFGGDVSHLNLHKTFCIPHGGGGPGIGPIGVVDKLKDFIPSHHEEHKFVGPVSGTDWGSASILPISWMYMKMMGTDGLVSATQNAILNTNYIATKLKGHYEILYKGKDGLVAHECIIDIRPLKETAGIEVEDVAKRLIDYGFHAPTMSWPVAGTLMIEPTESESLKELDRFCEAMIKIREEIREIEEGKASKDDNLLKNAPHTAKTLITDSWTHEYNRSKAAYPVDNLYEDKYWPPVGRVDNVYGDRNLVCSCPSMEDYE
ncbi:MAG: glycine dehydrogenase (aminomethyl-transferring) [Gammaproteobacteria bacterium]|nr:MAG: glycine dehydrogenase (aminomethyl-transferring) [Gammaproteobacteria bacterium]